MDDIELILVDDGSPDQTWAQITEVASDHEWVHGIRLSRNYGQHNALLAGLRAARHDLVLTMDDDLQNPPEAIPLLLAALTEDVDLVYGTPIEESHSRRRNLASVAAKRLMSASLGPDVHAQSSAFRAFRRRILNGSANCEDPYLSIDVLLSWATTRIAVVEVDFATRQQGTSGYSFLKLLRHALNMVTGYSTRPLRAVSVIGLTVSAVSLLLMLYTLIRFAIDPSDVEGFAFLAVSISLFSGVQLLSLGVLAEYLSRMHFRTMGRPAYTTRATTSPSRDSTTLDISGHRLERASTEP